MNNELNKDFTALPAKTLGDVLTGMIQQLETGNTAIVGQLRDVSKTTVSSIDRVVSNTAVSPSASSSSSTGKDLLNAFNPLSANRGTNILTSLFLGPLWKGLFSLFSGGGNAQPVPLTKYAFPQDSRSDVAASLGSDGQPVGIRSDSFGLSQATPALQAPINISIQALDARSILDRSDDIASALKQALLSNHEINDSISEL